MATFQFSDSIIDKAYFISTGGFQIIRCYVEANKVNPPNAKTHMYIHLVQPILASIIGQYDAQTKDAFGQIWINSSKPMSRLDFVALKAKTLELVEAKLDLTISAIVGPFWSCTQNAFGSISGQDRVHPKTGLITIRQLLTFYKNADNKVDFAHFTTLKDLATNCSMNLRKGNHWVAEKKPRFERPAQSNNQDQLAQLMKMVEQLNATVSAQQQQINIQQQQINILLSRR
jgi:hypothetical protein